MVLVLVNYNNPAKRLLKLHCVIFTAI